ncbi:MAG: RNA polymerase sigma factor SigJ [Notoacmeibacter sp.]|nr:RNA polymerase sigma factor SigJ [Notoacmeibacter sp.]MCC0032381.1 RNA polymerase sigma factor SigJ [Brucellaceae bacterium]
MTEELRLAAFLAARPRLLRLAYRYLQTVSEAEDVVQDCWLRFSAAAIPDDCESYLARIVTRLCLDRLKSATHRRETYVGPWLPEPLAGATEPAGDTALDISFAVMRALETLSPEERAAYFLHDLFDVPFAEIASELGMTPAHCRKLAGRARERLQSSRQRSKPGDAQLSAFLQVFLEAVQTGNEEPLRRMLAEDVEFVSDGGGKALAALNIVRGRDAVARLLLGLARKQLRAGPPIVRPVHFNGMAGLALLEGERLDQVMSFDLDASGAIAALYTVRNPDKLDKRLVANGQP